MIAIREARRTALDYACIDLGWIGCVVLSSLRSEGDRLIVVSGLRDGRWAHIGIQVDFAGNVVDEVALE